jgi:hypothetical protein
MSLMIHWVGKIAFDRPSKPFTLQLDRGGGSLDMSRNRNSPGQFTKQENMYMSFKKLALTTAVAVAMGAATLPANAMVYGIAGEALLVPAALNDPANQGTGNTNTYVVLKLPTILGSDFVMNNYSAPNIRAGVPAGQGKTIIPDPAYGWQVHWTWFDPKSKNPKNGTCEGSPNDVIVWTTDKDLLDLQRDVDVGLEDTGDVPKTFCGSATLPPAGYVVFQTKRGADSLAADFAMEGTAYITDDNIAENTVALLSVPVIPMADGEDPAPSNAGTSPRLGLNEVIQPVTSNGGGKGDLTAVSPVVASPLATGIRMNDGDPGSKLATSFAGGIQGGINAPAYSMHVLWFDRNNDQRTATSQTLIWDEHENPESLQVPIDYELNIIVYNSSVQIDKPGAFSPPWDFDLAPTEGQYTNLIAALMAQSQNGTYGSTTFNLPFNWAFSVMGYAEYILQEEGNELGGVGGAPGTNASAVAFEAQEDMYNSDAWSQHLMTLRGFR